MFNRIIGRSKHNTTRQSPENAPRCFNDLPGLSDDINENLKTIKNIFINADDLIIREFKIGTKGQINAFAVMIVGLINEASVNENLIRALNVSTPGYQHGVCRSGG